MKNDLSEDPKQNTINAFANKFHNIHIEDYK